MVDVEVDFASSGMEKNKTRQKKKKKEKKKPTIASLILANGNFKKLRNFALS